MKVEYKLKYENFFQTENIKDISIKNGCIKFEKEINILNINIELFAISENEITDMLLKILDLLFLAYGAFPMQIPSQLNAYKFETDTAFTNNAFVVADINECLINDDTLIKVKKRTLWLDSLQYVVSKSYKPVNIYHKLLLMLHCFEGIYSYSNKKQECYKNIVKDVINKVFDGNELNCLFTVLDIDIDDFCNIMSDTRHDMSHFLDNTDKKKNSLLKLPVTGTVVYGYILFMYCTLRLHFLKHLGVSVNQEKLTFCINTIHDYILDGKSTSEAKNFLTGIYQLNQKIESLQKRQGDGTN